MILAVALLAGTPDWVPVGQSASRLRVFVDRASLRIAGDRRQARMRLGAPHAIAGRIVLVYQDWEVDCANPRRWRMLGFEAQDEDGGVVQHRDTPDAAFLPAIDATIGGEVARSVCALR